MTASTDTYSVTELEQDARSLIGRIKESGHAAVLTVDGRAEAVIQDIASYEAILDRLRAMEDLIAVREGLAQADAGNSRGAREVFAELKQRHGL